MKGICGLKFLLSSVCALGLLASCGPAAAGGMMHGGGGIAGRGMMHGMAARHVYVMHHGVPSPYAGMSTPVHASGENTLAGKQLYEENCAACHGASGRGDGELAANLRPRPADLTQLGRLPIASDAYLYWAVSEGGAQFRSAMPAMKGTLTEEDIWKLVLYLRTF